MFLELARIIRRKRFPSNTKGSVIIEFAIIFPILFFLIGTIIEFSLIFLTEAVLEASMTDLGRYARIQIVQAEEAGVDISKDFPDMLKQHVEDNGFGIVNKENMVLTTDVTLAQDQAYLKYLPEYCIDPTGIRVPMLCVTGNKPCETDMILDDANLNAKCDTGEEPPLVTGDPGDVVAYRLIYKWGLISPLLSTSIADDRGEYIVEVYGVVRNEE